MNTDDPPQDSLHLAYGFVTHAYEWGLSSLEAVERRLQGLLVYLATITFVPPVAIMAISQDTSLLDGFQSRAVWAFGSFVVATILLILARLLRSQDLPNLDAILEQGLDKAPAEFMETILYKASQDLKSMQRVLGKKSSLADGVSLIIVGEIVIWLWPWIEPLVIWL